MSKLSDYDDELRTVYSACICGCDEVGRGSFAGPLVAAAVVLDKPTGIPRIRDSKSLSTDSITQLAEQIKAVALSYAIVEVDSDLIDICGVDWANQFAMVESSRIASSGHDIGVYVVDQSPKFVLKPHLMMSKADATSEAVAAASIIAKEYRDRLMTQLATSFPGYDFDKSKGYVSGAHVAGAKEHGLIPHVHRYSYKIKGVTVPLQPVLWDFLPK